MGKMDSDLISMCQMFLVPATILFAAIGLSQTEGLKTLVSVLGTVIGAIWVIRVYMWTGMSKADWWTGLSLASVFALASIISLLVHGYYFYDEFSNLK